MVSLALITNSIRHAWRLRLPAVLAVLMLLALIGLPQFTVGDGSPEGNLRLYLLYAGHLCVFALSLAAACYSIWFEQQERQHKVHYLLHSRPVSAKLIIFCRIVAYLSMFLFIAMIYFAAMIWTAHRQISRMSMIPEQKLELYKKLVEVRERVALRPIIEIDPSRQRLEKVEQSVITMEAGQSYPFELPLSVQKSYPVLFGKLLSLGQGEKTLLRADIVQNNRVLWRQEMAYVPGQFFRLPLPEALANLTQLELRLTQVNPDKKPLYLPLSEPLSITHPAGHIWKNILRGSLMLTLLLGVLICLGVFSAQVLSPQGSLLVLTLVYIVGSCKDSIRNLVFPPLSLGMPVPNPNDFQVMDVIYAMIWKPLLWLIPDFQALNPITQIMNGDYISWQIFLHQGVSTLPFLTLSAFYLFYFLPRQERCLEP